MASLLAVILPQSWADPRLLVIFAVLWIIYTRIGALRLPGPVSLPLVGNILQIDRKRPFLTLYKWFRRYGGVYRMTLSGQDIVVVTGYDELQEVLVTRGVDFAGRAPTWCVKYAFNGKGIVHSHDPDAQWRDLRTLCHLHTREYSIESKKVKNLLADISYTMFAELEVSSGKVNGRTPHEVIMAASIRSLSSLILGINISNQDPLFFQLREYCKMSSESVTFFGDRQTIWLNRWPWLRHVGPSAFQNLQKIKILETEIWQEIKRRLKGRPERTSLGRLLLEAIDFPAKFKSVSDLRITDLDAQRTAFSIYATGITFVTNSFHDMLHIIAENQESQALIRRELVQHLGAKAREVSLKDKPYLPYTRAAILESFRYSSSSGFGRIHRALTDTKIGDIDIAENTVILCNLWALHHDETFWENPNGFSPERFLDASGNLAPADHPNRKRLIPFGAGPRMCVGESLATSRLFLWLCNFVLRYHVIPGGDHVTRDCRDYVMEAGVLRYPSDKIYIVKRL